MLNLFLEDIGKQCWADEVFAWAKPIIRFIRSHQESLAIFGAKSQLDLKQPGVKSCHSTPFLCMLLCFQFAGRVLHQVPASAEATRCDSFSEVVHQLVTCRCGADPTQFGTSFYALERLAECRHALEESVESVEFHSCIGGGDAGQSCLCCATFSRSLGPTELCTQLQSSIRKANSARRQ